MSKLRISDAPLLPDVNGAEKIPTGGRGDYAVSVDQIKDYARGGLPQQIEDHINDTENPHQVSKNQVGLGNVDNTSDVDKPISTATQEALDLKANQSTTYTKTEVDGRLGFKADKTYVDSQDNLKADKTYVDSALTGFSNGASKFYPTLAAANADIANIALKDKVEVGEVANGGVWYKATAGATTLTKSAYDPLTQAKADATTKANAAEANAKLYTDTSIETTVGSIVEKTEGASSAIYIDNEGFVIASIDNRGNFINPNGDLNSTIEKVEPILKTQKTKLAQAVTDDDGTILLGVYEDGTLETPHPPIQGFSIEAIRSQMLPQTKINAAGVYLDKQASAHLEPLNWEVMVAPHATDGMGHCRMGSMYQLSPTKFYVAFTQFQTAGTDQAGGRLVARFVDVDFTNKTSVVGETRVIHDGIPNLEHPPAQPHFFKVKDGVILIFNLDHDLVTYKSTDGCLTWNEIGRYSPAPRTFWLALDGIAHMQNGVYKDRLVATGFTWKDGGSQSYFLRSLYSDDFGVTWNAGYDFDPVTIGLSNVMNETGVTVDANNDLILIVRNESSTDGIAGKTFFKSTDGGKTITRFYPDTPFLAATCQTGIFQFAQNSWEGVPKIITTSPTQFGSRGGLKLRVSYDNCKSWVAEYDIFPQSVTTGYSSIKRIDGHTIGVVCEYGGFNTISNIAIKFLNFKEISNGAAL